jgi:hypothetical protein
MMNSSELHKRHATGVKMKIDAIADAINSLFSTLPEELISNGFLVIPLKNAILDGTTYTKNYKQYPGYSRYMKIEYRQSRANLGGSRQYTYKLNPCAFENGDKPSREVDWLTAAGLIDMSNVKREIEARVAALGE